MSTQNKLSPPPAPPSRAGRAAAPPPPPPPSPPPAPRRPRRPLLVAPRWWYLIDRRIVVAVAGFLVIATGAAAFAAFAPQPVPPAEIPRPAQTRGERAKARFIAKADRRCVAASGRVAGLTFPETQAEAVAYVTTGLAINRRLLQDIRSLGAPKKDRALLRKALRAFDRSLDVGGAYLAALQSANPSLIAVTEARYQRATIRANGLARAYGFDACAEGT